MGSGDPPAAGAAGRGAACQRDPERGTANIQGGRPCPLTNALDKIFSLSVSTYIKDGKDEREAGLIAQEVQEVIPEVVVEHDDGLLSMDYSRITAHLVKAMQEQQRLIEELRSEIEQLKR